MMIQKGPFYGIISTLFLTRKVFTMSRRKKQIDYYGIDTETYTRGGEGLLSIQIYGKDTSEYIGVDRDIIDLPDEDIRYILLDEFQYFLGTLENDSIFYFFNLKFDFSQMEKYFLTHYEISDEFNLKKGQISILQSPNRIYSIRFRSPISGRMVYFHDLFNLVNSSLDSACYTFLGERKIEIGDKNFSKRTPTYREVQYAKKDAELTYKLAMALKDIDGFDLTSSITIGARTLNLFKDIIRCKSSTYDVAGHTIHLNGHPYTDLWSYFELDKDILQEYEDWIRLGVRGGITQAYQIGVFDDCVHLDINSAHPSQMVKEIPYGAMLDDIPDGSYSYMAFPKGYFKLKRGGLKIMTFRSKAYCLRYHNLRTGEELEPAVFASSFYLDGSFGIWKDEYEQILSQYDFDPDEPTIFKYFKTRKDQRLSALIGALYEGKETASGAKRTVFKYLLNSLYGKFLTRPDGKTIEYVKEDGKIKRKVVTDEGRKTVHLALGSWISMMTRVQLIEACLSVPRDTLLYCDTDSVIFTRYDNWEKDFVLGDELGSWALESKPSNVNIIGPKTYQEVIDGKVITKCAGLSRRISAKIAYGDLVEGLEVMRLKAERNPETLAIRLVERPFSVSTKPTIYMGGH